MDWEIKSDRPVYLQLMEKIQFDVVSGIYKPGGNIPSVRELAAQVGVNPNTMQKALVELEKKACSMLREQVADLSQIILSLFRRFERILQEVMQGFILKM